MLSGVFVLPTFYGASTGHLNEFSGLLQNMYGFIKNLMKGGQGNHAKENRQYGVL